MQQAISVVRSLLVGGVWAGACALIAARVRETRALFREPGHWLAVAVGAAYVFYSLLVVWMVANKETWWQDSAMWYRMIGAVPLVVCFVAVFCVGTVGWRLIFVVFSLNAALGILTHLCLVLGKLQFISFVMMLNHAGQLVLTMCLAIFVLIDILKRNRRDWIHWIGVATVISNSITSMAWSIWTLIVR